MKKLIYVFWILIMLVPTLMVWEQAEISHKHALAYSEYKATHVNRHE